MRHNLEEKNIERLQAENSRLQVLLKGSEEKLKRSESLRHQLAMVVDGTLAGSWDWHLESGAVTVNSQWAAMIGYSLGELEPVTIGTWQALCHPDDFMQSKALLDRHFSGESEFYEIELRMRHKNGQWIWVLDRGKVFQRDEEGRPLRMVGSHQDISARKNAEEKLRQERNLFMGGPVSVFRWRNTPGLPVEYVSPNIETLFGYSSHELIGGTLGYSSLIHPDDLPRVQAELALFSADLFCTSFEQEYRIIRKDGTELWVYDFTVITRDEQSRITHYEGYLLDNSSRKRSEASLAFNRKFEWIVSSLANRFINVSAGDIDAMINEALKIIGEFVQADRSYIFQYYDNQRLMDNTHEWCAEGVEPQIDILKQLPTDDFSWSTKKIARNELIIVPRVSDLPDEAASEREILQQQDIQSLILIPLVSGTIPFGYIGFDAVREERQWPKEAASVLTLAGGIIANALQRKQVEQLIQSELDLALRLNASSSFEETLKSCLQTALDISGMDCGGIYLISETDNSLILAYSQGLSDGFVSESFCYLPDSSQCRLVANGSAIYSRFREMNTNPSESILNEGLKAIAVLPVISKSRVVASLNVASHSLDQVPEFARKALETVASHIGAAIVQATHEEKIATANRNFASLFDTIDDMLFIIADDGTILHTNAASTASLGYSQDEFRGMHVLDVHPSGRREEAGRTLQQMLSGQANACLVPLRSKSCEHIPVETKITHGTWDGKPVLFGISRNITERIKNQSALVESERKFRELTEFLPLPLFETDLQGKVTYINLEVKKFFGLSRDDLQQGVSAFSFCTFEELDIALENQKKILAPGYVPRGNEYNIIMKDGSRRSVLLYSSPIRLGDRVSGVRTTVVDLSELKRAESALRESALLKRVSEEFKSIIDNIPGAVYRISSSGAIRFLSVPNSSSPAVELLSGLSGSLEEVISLIHAKDRQIVIDSYQQLCQEPASQVITYRVGLNGSKVRWIEDRKTSVFSEDGVFSGIDGILFDITDRVMAQEENRQLESRLRSTQRIETIGTLAGGIAHDFNNILTPILGYAEMGLLSLPDHDPLQEYFSEITKAAERARNLVAQILSFSRADERTPSVVGVQAIVKEALKLLRPSIPSTITIEQMIDNTCSNILADPSQIHQVIVNLCTNAFQAMEESGGVLSIDLREILPDAGMLKMLSRLSARRYLQLSVTDTGTGMDEATMERIFEPFFTTKSVNKGTGLGLSVVHGIITSYNGEIAVDSKPGKGTAFRIYLPVINESAEEETSEKPFGKGNASILFVDDEQASVRMMTMMMTKLGFTIRALSSPLEALELFRHNSERFDLVITDLTMPDMTGIELARQLHEISPQLPVILMTGYGKDLESTIPLSRYGICRFLKKPVNLALLASTINDVICSNNA